MSLNIDGVPFDIIDNIVSYNSEPHGWVLQTSTVNVSPECRMYFIIDSKYHDAFFHWVYEDAVFLMYFKELQKTYPSLKIACKQRKRYKELFYKKMDVLEHVVYEELQLPNRCIVPSVNMFTNEKAEFTEIGKSIIRKMMGMFRQPVKERTIDYLVMPRQKLENYYGNDRVIEMESIYKQLQDKSLQYTVLNTDEITDLQIQMDIINNSKCVIVTDGAAFLVNGMFIEGVKIIVLPFCTQQQSRDYPKIKFIVDQIALYNTVIYSHNI